MGKAPSTSTSGRTLHGSLTKPSRLGASRVDRTNLAPEPAFDAKASDCGPFATEVGPGLDLGFEGMQGSVKLVAFAAMRRRHLRHPRRRRSIRQRDARSG